jgi:uncharacterized protein (DUF1800 family)
MNLQQAGHMLRRTTFGFTAARLHQVVAEGAEKTIDRLLATPSGYASFEQSVAALTSRESSPQDAANLWLYRILNTPHPLLEKMTLFWRDYFRVMSPKFLQHLREHALGRFDALLPEVRHDPADAARRLSAWLIGDGVPVPQPFLDSFSRDNDIAKLVSAILRSSAFSSPACYRRRVKTPLEFALNLSTALDAPLAAAPLHGQLAALGQHLPEPDTGRRWLNAFTIIGRSNLAAGILAKVTRYPDRRTLLETLLQNDAPPAVLEGLAPLEGRELAQAIANLPEFQQA